MKPHARTLLSSFLAALFFVSQAAPAVAQKKAPETKARTSLVERVGSTGILQIEAESFRTLTPRQQTLAYWLSQAAIAVDPVIYDQVSRWGLRQKRLLEAVVAHPRGTPAPVLKKITDFAKVLCV